MVASATLILLCLPKEIFMPQFTILQREHLVRAESDAATIDQFKLCGYIERGVLDALNSEEAMSQYQASDLARENPKAVSPVLRKVLWFGGIMAVLWFAFLIFGLLPLAF